MICSANWKVDSLDISCNLELDCIELGMKIRMPNILPYIVHFLIDTHFFARLLPSHPGLVSPPNYIHVIQSRRKLTTNAELTQL